MPSPTGLVRIGLSDLDTLPGHLIRRLQQIAVSIFLGKLDAAGFDLTPVQFAALTAARDHPGLDQATMAGMIAYDRATIGGVVDRLAHKGYVRREVSERDRRARTVHLTDTGADLLARAAPLVLDVQAEILAGFSAAEQRTFLRLLRKATERGNDLSRAPLRAASGAGRRARPR